MDAEYVSRSEVAETSLQQQHVVHPLVICLGFLSLLNSTMAAEDEGKDKYKKGIYTQRDLRWQRRSSTINTKIACTCTEYSKIKLEDVDICLTPPTNNNLFFFFLIYVLWTQTV